MSLELFPDPWSLMYQYLKAEDKAPGDHKCRMNLGLLLLSGALGENIFGKTSCTLNQDSNFLTGNRELGMEVQQGKFYLDILLQDERYMYRICYTI